MIFSVKLASLYKSYGCAIYHKRAVTINSFKQRKENCNDKYEMARLYRGEQNGRIIFL